MKDRPNSVPTRPTKKGTPRMAPYEPSTIQSRTKTMSMFVGFCSKVLALEPTMEHTTDPQVVAKYWGWHQLRGTQVRGGDGMHGGVGLGCQR